MGQNVEIYSSVCFVERKGKICEKKQTKNNMRKYKEDERRVRDQLS
jgi:hypothetical protein